MVYYSTELQIGKIALVLKQLHSNPTNPFMLI
jgi:hypothetical protein